MRAAIRLAIVEDLDAAIRRFVVGKAILSLLSNFPAPSVRKPRKPSMAQAPLYLLTAVDVRRASSIGDSRAIIISSLTLPGLTFATAEHNPGGGVMAVNFAMPRIETPEPAFSAKGIDTDIFRGMGEIDRWTFAGSYNERGPGGGRAGIPGRGIIEGVVTAWEPDESDPAEFQGCTHTFAEVTHYEFTLDGKELFYVDTWERVLRVGGKDLMAAHRTGLGA